MDNFDAIWCLLIDNKSSTRWEDEFGNTITAFFVDHEAVKQFEASGGVDEGTELVQLPISAAVNVIVGHIREKTTYFTLDPISREAFRPLTAEEFLSELLGRVWLAGMHDAEGDSIITDFDASGDGGLN